MNKYLILFLAVCLFGCGKSIDKYYYLNSPNDERVLTVVRVKRLFDFPGEQNKKGSGIYLFNGYVDEIAPFPMKYLKLDYSDFSPIGIIWDDTISISYNYIVKNTFDSDGEIKVFNNISSSEFIKVESNYKSEHKNDKTAYDLDEIFRNH